MVISKASYALTNACPWPKICPFEQVFSCKTCKGLLSNVYLLYLWQNVYELHGQINHYIRFDGCLPGMEENAIFIKPYLGKFIHAGFKRSSIKATYLKNQKKCTKVLTKRIVERSDSSKECTFLQSPSPSFKRSSCL